MIIIAGVCALLLATTHFLVDYLNFSNVPRDKWLSAAGGISVAYVFVHILPELNKWQETFAESINSNIGRFFEHHLYLVALFGLTFFYGVERVAKVSKESNRKANQNEASPNIRIFWIHIFSFAIYNFLIGYLLIHRENSNFYSLLIFVIAMAFHFLVNDFGLLDHYENTYQKKGRWIIAVAIIIGWVVGVLTKIGDPYIGIIFAFIAGGIIMNVLKEELPENRQSKFLYLVLGVVVYSALLLFI